MENIGNYVNLSKLFAANQKMNAYNNYQKNVKNGERVEDALFNSADINGDGKIDLNDYKDFLSLTGSKNLTETTDKTDKYLNGIKKRRDKQ